MQPDPSSPADSALIEARLDQAFDAYEQGRLDQACEAFQSVLALSPQEFDALHMLGVMATQQRDLPRAIDLLRRAVIGALMCHFAISKESFATSYLIDFDHYFATELEDMAEYEKLGLVELDSGAITVTPKGRLLVRNIAMAFDRYLRQDRERRRYSRVI